MGKPIITYLSYHPKDYIIVLLFNHVIPKLQQIIEQKSIRNMFEVSPPIFKPESTVVNGLNTLNHDIYSSYADKLKLNLYTTFNYTTKRTSTTPPSPVKNSNVVPTSNININKTDISILHYYNEVFISLIKNYN